MDILSTFFMIAGILTLFDVIKYMIAKRYYAKHPELDKSANFDVSDFLYSRKYVKIVYIVLGILFLAVSIIISSLR